MAIIVGVRTDEEIAEAIRAGYGEVRIAKPRGEHDWSTLAVVDRDRPAPADAVEANYRNISVYKGRAQTLHPDPVTYVEIAERGDAIAILEAAVAPFGGFISNVDDAPWRPHAGPAAALAPKLHLLLDLAAAIGGEAAAAACAGIDADKAGAAVRALQAYGSAVAASENEPAPPGP